LLIVPDAQPHNTSSHSLERRIFRPANEAELREAVDLAFDYRGDVTLELTSRQKIEGYLFNRNALASPPFLQLFPKGQPGEWKIPYPDIVAIAFTGEDTASGKSWEAWVKKKETERKAEAARLVAEAQARGHL
jgi:hypothetical protein